MNLKGYRVAMAIIAAAFLAMTIAGCSSDDNGAPMVEPMVTPDPDPVTPDPDPEPPAYDPTAPGGTREDAGDRAAAQRIDEAVGRVTVIAGVPAVMGVDLNNNGDFTDSGDTAPMPAVPAVMGGRIQGGVSIDGLSQARLGMPAQLTLAVTGGTGLGTADDSAGEAPAIPGWTGVSLMKDGPGAISQMALVYSDAERSVRAFDDVYSYNRDEFNISMDVSLTHRWVLNPVTENDQATTEVDESLLSAQDSRIMLHHELSTTGVRMRTMVQNEVDADPPATPVRGYYDGVPGQYLCAGGDCTVSITDTGAVQLTGENATTNLLFKADDPDTVIPDRDYLAFGVWTEVPDDPTLANPGRVRPFVHGSAGPFTKAQIDMLTGKASYSGGAVGHYATRAAGSHMADQGRFTATASLSANFDGGIPPLLSGSISGFMTEDSTAMEGWLVNLSGGAMGGMSLTDTKGIDVDGTTSGTTGSQSWGGVWEAWFFGTNTANHPTGVAGNFQAEAGTAQPIHTPEGRINMFDDTGFAGVVGSFAGR